MDPLLLEGVRHDGATDTKTEAVPDGIVYTDIKQNLVIGNPGVLTCRFNKDPIAVYWLKGIVPEQAPIQVIWHEGSKSGSRYEDGTYDIDRNFSLIIKEVKDADRGRYICRVSNHRGILINNYTDVTLFSTGLEMDPYISLQKGLPGIIPCKINIRPKIVSWKKINSSSELIKGVERYDGKVHISDNETGKFKITEDYSLFITNVDIEDEGQYICEVLEVYTYEKYKNSSSISVFAHPIDPFPVIEGCQMNEDHSNCIFTVDLPTTITCRANNYYPYIGLYLKDESNVVKSLNTQTWSNTDGTKNKSVSIVGHISRNVYTCVAYDIPGVDANKSTSVRLIRQNSSPNLVIIVPLIITSVLFATGLLSWILYRFGKAPCLSKGDIPARGDGSILLHFIRFHSLSQLQLNKCIFHNSKFYIN
ncbi:uncharacterized protein LOC135155239 [Lytechinus pictus]|uniref:uncharacterized protein LOC135155239 n=1 Tax=Lytechinus pictus TaxID=7653 RepID=UPI0030B9FAA7